MAPRRKGDHRVKWDRKLLDRTFRRLCRRYGEPIWKRDGNALEQLIWTVLSQNTNDVNSSAAFRGLRRAFPRWSDVMAAAPRDVARSIQVGGLSNQKAVVIQSILQRLVQERGRPTLEFVGRMPLEEARSYLSSFKGVGQKTVNCTLLFSFNLPAFPVDTHIHRIARRTGMTESHLTADEVAEALERCLPPKRMYAMHIMLIWLGRDVCHPSKPECGRCVLADQCASAPREKMRDKR